MELKPIPADLDELRKVIISSNLTTCYLVLDALALKKGSTLRYQEFKDEWIEMYKDTYRIVSKMKPRRSTREPAK